ncbi:3-deoxy-manno-octulosonate cytidylyltransferase [bacterium]|nr:3-deoxy-manno-octulosonate cytidylyltransferase [bacterium]
MTQSKVVGVIPARYQSTRLPGKMLSDIQGKPLIVRTFETVRNSSLIDRLVVATDDGRIAEAIETAGGEVVLTAPDLPSGSDRVHAAVQDLAVDIVVNIQGDEPLLPPGHIDRTIQLLLDTEEFMVTTAACPIPAEDLNNPDVVKVVTDAFGRALYFSRSAIPHPRGKQAPDPLFRRHIGLYAFRRVALERFTHLPPSNLEQCERLEQLRMLEHGIPIGVVDVSPVPAGVDTPDDLRRVRMTYNDPDSPVVIACLIPDRGQQDRQ